MDHFEYLKSGFEAAQQRFNETQQRMQKMQAEFNSVVQEFNAWQTLYRAEIAKQGTAPQSPQINIPLKPEANKTELIRTVLRERPTGMTPSEIWKQVSGQIVNRVYLYSVLKRLRAKGDVVERRGKYFPKLKPEGEGMVIQ